MAVIPVRLPPLPGEALDSWLETYAHLLHVTVPDIFNFAGVDWDRVNGDQRTGKPWLHQLDEPDLAALSAATGIPPWSLAGMTLARYQGTGLAEATAEPGRPRAPRWWRQLSGSRYCPRCLAANGGRWMLAWRIPWTFACARCQVLLADTCPDCARRHRRTRTGQPRQPGRCQPSGHRVGEEGDVHFLGIGPRWDRDQVDLAAVESPRHHLGLEAPCSEVLDCQLGRPVQGAIFI